MKQKFTSENSYNYIEIIEGREKRRIVINGQIKRSINRRLTSVEDRAILGLSRIFSKMAAHGSPTWICLSILLCFSKVPRDCRRSSRFPSRYPIDLARNLPTTILILFLSLFGNEREERNFNISRWDFWMKKRKKESLLPYYL